MNSSAMFVFIFFGYLCVFRNLVTSLDSQCSTHQDCSSCLQKPLNTSLCHFKTCKFGDNEIFTSCLSRDEDCPKNSTVVGTFSNHDDCSNLLLKGSNDLAGHSSNTLAAVAINANGTNTTTPIVPTPTTNNVTTITTLPPATTNVTTATTSISPATNTTTSASPNTTTTSPHITTTSSTLTPVTTTNHVTNVTSHMTTVTPTKQTTSPNGTTITPHPWKPSKRTFSPSSFFGGMLTMGCFMIVGYFAMNYYRNSHRYRQF